jgi:hypothetical protein
MALFAWTAIAQTATTTTQASTASANFAYVSDDGCVQNEVMVFVTRSTVASAKGPTTTAEVTYTRYRYDYCADVDQGTELGASSRPVFSGDLNRASLTAAINGHTASGTPVTVSLALVWDGRGSITRKAGNPQAARSGGAKVIRSENWGRNAVVNGTMDERDISFAMVGARLQTTQTTIAH